jgi:hypothetical protein
MASPWPNHHGRLSPRLPYGSLPRYCLMKIKALPGCS